MAQDLSWKVGTYANKFSNVTLQLQTLCENKDNPLTSLIQGPAKKWEEVLLGLGVEGSKAGIEGEEIAPLAKENVATP